MTEKRSSLGGSINSNLLNWFDIFQNSPLTELLEEGLIDFEAIRREGGPLCAPSIDFSDFDPDNNWFADFTRGQQKSK